MNDHDHFNPQLEHQLEDLEDEILATSRSPRYKLNKWGHELMQRSRSAAELSDDYVRQKPWRVLIAAACAGLLLGSIVRNTLEKSLK